MGGWRVDSWRQAVAGLIISLGAALQVASVQVASAQVALPGFIGNWLVEIPAQPPLGHNPVRQLRIGEFGVIDGRPPFEYSYRGCNAMRGELHVDNDKIRFQPGRGTLLACPKSVMEDDDKVSGLFFATVSFRQIIVDGLVMRLEFYGPGDALLFRAIRSTP